MRPALIVTPLLVVLGLGGTSRAEVTTLEPEADSYIYMADPDRNYGNGAFVRVRNNPASAIKTYLRFDLGSTMPDRSAIRWATLSLTAYNGGEWEPQAFRVFGLKDGHAGEQWIEGDGGADNAPAGELTWANAPANDPGSPVGFTDEAIDLGTFTPEPGATGTLSFTSEALLGFVKADTDGKVTLMISTDGSAFQSIDARERPTPPRLEVTHGDQ